MKRWLFGILAIALIFSATACSSGEETKSAETENETWTENLSARDLYSQASENTLDLSSALFTTRITGAVSQNLTTRRIRKGYDSFHYQRQGGGTDLTYLDGIAYLSSEDGSFSAPSSAENFESYLKENLYPTLALPLSSFQTVEKEGMTVRYQQGDGEIFSRYEAILSGWTVLSVSGEAEILPSLLISKETVTVKGSVDGAEKTVVLTTTLDQYRSENIQISPSVQSEGYLSVGDIRIPQMFRRALEAFSTAQELQLTAVSSTTLSTGENTFALHRELTYYQTRSPLSPKHYQSLQTLSKTPSGEEFLLHQTSISDGKKKETLHELTEAELLEESSVDATTLPGLESVKEWLPNLTELSSLTLFEGQADYTASFTFTDAALKDRLQEVIRTLDCGSYSLQSVSLSVTGGTATWSKTDGALISIGFYFQAKTGGTGELDATLAGQFSLNVDGTENVTVPALQTPTPTVPGQKPEGDHSHC